jgi:bifunctional non-homologous end joining protein LigD
VDEPPDGPDWLHEIKFDGYRMHARLDRGAVRLLTRTGLDWTHKYPAIASAVSAISAKQAYFDGELCGVRLSL